MNCTRLIADSMKKKITLEWQINVLLIATDVDYSAEHQSTIYFRQTDRNAEPTIRHQTPVISIK